MSKTREYIKEKNIEVLFEELMRYVINKKPENPVKYLISLLQEKGETIITKKPKTKISSEGPIRSRTCVSPDLRCAGQAIDIRKSLERILPKSFDSKPVMQEQDITPSRLVSEPPPGSTMEVRIPSTESAAPDIASKSGDVEEEEVVIERKERTDEGDDSIVVSREYVNNVESFFNFGRKKKKSAGSLASGSTATLKDDASDDEKADDSKKNSKKKDDKTRDADSENGEKYGKSKKKEKDQKKKAKREKDDEREDVTENEEETEYGKKKDKKKKKDDENSDKANDKKKKHKKEKKESEGEEKVDVVLDKAEALEYSEQNVPTECAENSEKEDNEEEKMEEPGENGAAAEEGDEETSPRHEAKECDIIHSVMTTASCDLTELASWRDGEMEIESILECGADVGGSVVEQSSVRDVQSAAPPSTHIIKQSEDIILKEEVFFAVKSAPGIGGKVGPRVTSPCNTVFFDEPAEDLPVLLEPTQLVAVFKIPENRLSEQRERILTYRNSGNSDDMSISELIGSPWTYADSIS